MSCASRQIAQRDNAFVAQCLLARGCQLLFALPQGQGDAADEAGDQQCRSGESQPHAGQVHVHGAIDIFDGQRQAEFPQQGVGRHAKQGNEPGLGGGKDCGGDGNRG